MKLNKLLSAFLIVCMVVSILPIGILNVSAIEEVDYSVKIGDITIPFDDYKPGTRWQSSRYYTDNNGKTVDLSSWECMGFARHVFYRLFGVVDSHDGGNGCYNVPNTKNVSAEYITESYLKGLFEKSVLPGAHIRTYNRPGKSGHSMIYMGSDASYIYVYDANSDLKNTVKVRRFSWGEFTNYIK